MNNIKHIEINIGKACNNKCRFCMSSKHALWDIKFVKLDILERKLKKYYDDGYRSVGFLGGDISIYPDIINIISFCKKLGFIEVQAITNAMVFDNYDFVEKIIIAGLTRINISVHSHDSEIEDYLTQVPGGLNRKKKAIDNINILYKKGLLKNPLSINLVLNKYNLSTIVETVLYFYKIKNINDIRINFIWLNDNNKENWENLKISYNDFLPYLKKLIYISLKENIRITFDTVPACIFYKVDNNNFRKIIKKFLGEDKDYIIEIDHVNKNLVFNWNYVKKFEEKIKFEQCKNCIYKKECQGVWKKYPLLFGNEEFIAIKN